MTQTTPVRTTRLVEAATWLLFAKGLVLVPVTVWTFVRAYRAGSGERDRVAKAAQSWPELYGAYYRQEHPGEEPPDALLSLFRDVLEEVGDATA